MEHIVFSVGGSLVNHGAPNTEFLKTLRSCVLDLTKEYGVILVVGGGAIARSYIEASKVVGVESPESHDIIGIASTVLNATLVQQMFGDQAYEHVVRDPTHRVETRKHIIVAAGSKPGWSTDYVAVMLAHSHNVKRIINLTNQDYVHDKDPAKHNTAIPLKTVTWVRMREIVGEKWVPGKNTPFDPVACAAAAKFGMQVACIHGSRLPEAEKFVYKHEFVGTLIE
jgi:uridylate kinase